MSTHDDLLSEMDTYSAEAGITPQTLGRLAGQGGNFYKRLKEGKRSWPETMDKVRDWMRRNPPGSHRGAA